MGNAESHNTRIQIEPEVTVITGANDVGKSLMLRILEAVFTKKALPEADQSTALVVHGGAEKGEPACWFCVTPEAGDRQQGILTGDFEPGDELVFYAPNRANFAAQWKMCYRSSTEIKPKNTPSIQKPPQVLLLAEGPEIAGIIDLDRLNPAEQKLAALAFGKDYSRQQHLSLSDASSRIARLKRAEGALNARIGRLLPESMNLALSLAEVPQRPSQIALTVNDPLNTFIGFGQRGAGVRRFITLLAHLAAVDPDVPTLILVDEPETSLHADAQHRLRHLLEELAKRPGIQTIYATHSPSMINNMRPTSIRLIKRGATNGAGHTSIVENKAFGENFRGVRASLGLTPVDSLLYATVTIVVEGETERTSLSDLLLWLAERGIPGFQDVNALLEECHLLDGNGGQFKQMCKLATSQCGVVLGLVDGDKAGDRAKKEAESLGVQVVRLPRGLDIEGIFPELDYLNAVMEWLAASDSSVAEKATYAEYQKYLAQHPELKNAPLAGRVCSWVQATMERHVSKPEVFRLALRNAKIEDAVGSRVVDTMKKLVEKIRSATSPAQTGPHPHYRRPPPKACHPPGSCRRHSAGRPPPQRLAGLGWLGISGSNSFQLALRP